MTPQDISVIIPAFNEAPRIGTAIESAMNEDAGEVIVCDGGSADDTVQVAQTQGATVVRSDPGRGRQLARGADAAKGAFLLFLHADNRLSGGCLTALCDLVNHADDQAQVWGGFRQKIDASGLIYRSLEWGNATRVRLRGMPFGDQAIFVSRSNYRRVGGFQTVPLMEDVLLARALRRQSWPKLIDRAIVVDARRWQKRGIIRQTLRNWGIQFAHSCGVSEDRLAEWYRR